MNSHALLIDIQRAMMQAARRVILCVDHTKFGRQSISRLCGLEEIDTLISNQSPPKEMLAALKAAGVEVILASADGPIVLSAGKSKPPRKREQPEAGADANRAAPVVAEAIPTAPSVTSQVAANEEPDEFID
jgi:hypothetical protein